jgi:hypothetical protein
MTRTVGSIPCGFPKLLITNVSKPTGNLILYDDRLVFARVAKPGGRPSRRQGTEHYQRAASEQAEAPAAELVARHRRNWQVVYADIACARYGTYRGQSSMPDSGGMPALGRMKLELVDGTVKHFGHLWDGGSASEDVLRSALGEKLTTLGDLVQERNALPGWRGRIWRIMNWKPGR